ncbi:MAG TPA: hypothetical protein VF116_18560 [Ktedonobacterales bacterium]
MRDGTPPRSGRAGRGDDPGSSRFRGVRPATPPPGGPGSSGRRASPYRPYGESSGRMPAAPAPGTGYGPAMGTGYGPAAGTGYGPAAAGFTAADLAAVHRRRIGLAIFHDGNPGHLWRGALASQLGEAVLSAGVVMWVVVLLHTPLAVAAAVLALALPSLLVRPFAARLENVREPRVPLIWIGRLRILCALGLIAMHFHTIVPALYALLFGVALLGRLRDAVRVAAFRTCLTPGEPAHVANDLHIGAVIAAVLGPLLATLFFILLGERILLVSIGAAVFFLISVNADGFLDALPEARRAYLLATPEMAVAEGGVPDALLDHPEDGDDEGDAEANPQQQRELGLPEWYQQGPRNARQAIADIRAGLGLAGQRRPGLLALLAVAALALVSGGLAVIEVFYITDAMGLPTFYLGPLLAAEGTGAALGMLLAGSSARWRLRLLGGTIVAGAALVALAHVPLLPIALGLLLVFGGASAVALIGARAAFHAEHTGVERRAIAAAEQWLAAFCGVVGAVGFTALFEDTFAGHYRLDAALPGWPIDVLLSLMGIGLVIAGVLLAVVPGLASKQKARRKAKGKGKGKGKAKGKHGAGAASDDGWGDDASGYYPAAGDGWDDEGAYDSTMQPAYGDTGYQTGYDTSYRPGYGETGEYETGYQTGYDQSYTGEYDARGGGLNFGRSSEYERGYTGEYGRYEDDADDDRGSPRGGGRSGRGRR